MKNKLYIIGSLFFLAGSVVAFREAGHKKRVSAKALAKLYGFGREVDRLHGKINKISVADVLIRKDK